MSESGDPVSTFIKAAFVPRDTGHKSGTLERAEEMLRAQPRIASCTIHTAALKRP